MSLGTECWRGSSGFTRTFLPMTLPLLRPQPHLQPRLQQSWVAVCATAWWRILEPEIGCVENSDISSHNVHSFHIHSTWYDNAKQRKATSRRKSLSNRRTTIHQRYLACRNFYVVLQHHAIPFRWCSLRHYFKSMVLFYALFFGVVESLFQFLGSVIVYYGIITIYFLIFKSFATLLFLFLDFFWFWKNRPEISDNYWII